MDERKEMLKNCPFCDSEMKWSESRTFTHAEDKDCIIQYIRFTEHETDKWNRRSGGKK
jgi:hypothetical protein